MNLLNYPGSKGNLTGEFEAYQRSSYTEKLREQLAKWVEEMMAPLVPVVICMSRANGRTEMLRRSGVYRDLRSGKLVDLEAQGEAQCEELRRRHELMEPVVQSMAEQAWQTEQTALELTPETLTKLVWKMKKDRRWDTVRAEMEFPHLMPLPLEVPVCELDLAETCPGCGGAKHKGEWFCGRCLLRRCARPGGRW